MLLLFNAYCVSGISVRPQLVGVPCTKVSGWGASGSWNLLAKLFVLGQSCIILSRVLGDVLLTQYFWSLRHQCIAQPGNPGPEKPYVFSHTTLPFSRKRIHKLNCYFVILRNILMEMIHPVVSQIHIHLLCTRQTFAVCGDCEDEAHGGVQELTTSWQRQADWAGNGPRGERAQERANFQLWDAGRTSEGSLEGWEDWIYRDGGGIPDQGKRGIIIIHNTHAGRWNLLPVLWPEPPDLLSQGISLTSCLSLPSPGSRAHHWVPSHTPSNTQEFWRSPTPDYPLLCTHTGQLRLVREKSHSRDGRAPASGFIPHGTLSSTPPHAPPHPISWELSALLLTAKSKLQPSFGSPPMPSLTPNRSQAGPHQRLTATQRHPRCPPRPPAPISPPPTQHSWQQGDWTPPAFITRISSSPGMSPWAPALNHHSPGPLHTLA